MLRPEFKLPNSTGRATYAPTTAHLTATQLRQCLLNRFATEALVTITLSPGLAHTNPFKHRSSSPRPAPGIRCPVLWPPLPPGQLELALRSDLGSVTTSKRPSLPAIWRIWQGSYFISLSHFYLHSFICLFTAGVSQLWPTAQPPIFINSVEHSHPRSSTYCQRLHSPYKSRAEELQSTSQGAQGLK